MRSGTSRRRSLRGLSSDESNSPNPRRQSRYKWTNKWGQVIIVNGDHDFVRVEHAVKSVKLIPNAELAVIPDASHFVLYSEQERVIPIVKHFLEKPEKRIPLETARIGYHPGETR